jgi:predicted RNA-binding Zn ribbon-like protein
METTADETTVPRELAPIEALVNTVEIDSGEEQLSSPAALRDWLAGQGLLDASAAVGEADLAAAIELREALRAMLRVNDGAPADPAAVEAVNRAAAGLPLRVAFDGAGDPGLRPGAEGGARGALAELLAGIAVARANGTWARLKACSDPDCQWAFYDRSKNRSGRWCSMRTCGNRTKTRAYRTRRRSAGEKTG